MGCVTQVGAQAVNIGRNAVLAAGLPESVPGTTVDRQCGSSQQAMHFAAQGVMSGQYDVGGRRGRRGHEPRADGGEHRPRRRTALRLADRGALRARSGGLVPQGISAEMIADRWDLSREDLDRFAESSQHNAARATAEGRFEREILPVVSKHKDRETGRITESGEMVTVDEGIRPDTSMEGLAKLKPSFKPDGKVTAGNSSQITDGASAVLIMSEEKAGVPRSHPPGPVPRFRRWWAPTLRSCSRDPSRRPPRSSSGPSSAWTTST